MTRRYFYDFEFIEDGVAINALSIGIVRDDGSEYYAVFKDAPWYAVRDNPWLMANVVPHLPHDAEREKGMRWIFDMADPCVKKHSVIRKQVADFLTSGDGPVELWGYYAAYDHVALAQLYGPMVKLPKGIPMWTNDVQQYAHQLGLTLPPVVVGTEHSALDDARWTRDAWQYLNNQKAFGAV